jgi:hypothetical protein
MMARAPIARAAVVGSWTHAHEEDRPPRMVFRPSRSAFPPSRGRRTLELRADGSLREEGPGATDRPEGASGRWEWEAPGILALYRGRDRSPFQRLRVLAAAPDRLELAPET